MELTLCSLLMCLHGLCYVQAMEMASNDRSNFPPLTTSNALREMLNQDSLLRFSMVQKFQNLVVDVLDNKNDSMILKRKLKDITTELKSIAAEDQAMKKENAQLKQELNTIKEAIKYDKHLTMQQSESLKRNLSDVYTELRSIAAENQLMKEENAQLKQDLNTVKETIKHDRNHITQQIQSLKRTEINALAEKIEEETSQVRQELTNCNETNRRMDLENFRIKQEFNKLKMMSSDNKLGTMQNSQDLNIINETISKHSDDFWLQMQTINTVLQQHDAQFLNMSSQLLSVCAHFWGEGCKAILQCNPDLKGIDGAYSIFINNQEKEVYCDMTTDGGGWTVIQKRVDGSTDFFRNWTDYKRGFGDPSQNYWIGNDAIHALTIRDQELRVDLQSFDNQTVYALYSEFKVGNENSKYQLTVGGYSGTAGDSLAFSNGHKFSTRDQDNDVNSGNCAVKYYGGWWYRDCHESNLNGLYAGSVRYGYKYTVWNHWKSSEALKRTKMMIRPKS